MENQAYEPRVVRLKLKLVPEDFVTVFPEEQIIALDSKEKQLVTVQLKKRQSATYYPDYNLSVQIYDDASNESISSVILPIRSLSAYRMVNYNGNLLPYKNFVEASYNNTDNTNEYYKLRSNFEQKISNSTRIGFNTTADYYTDSKNVNLYDTRLELLHSKFYAGLGNIYGQDYDFNVSGRGLKLGAKINAKNQLEVLGVDNNYMLYSDFSKGGSNGKTAGLQYSFISNKKQKTQVNYIYNQNNFTKVNTHLLNAKSSVYSDSLQVLSMDFGLSQENLSTDLHSLDKKGWALGANYTYTGAKYAISSNNYYSSPYYSGVRRGALYLDEMLNYRLSQTSSAYLRYNTSVNKSGYLNDLEVMGYTENSNFINHLLEAGWTWSGKSLRFSVSPNYVYQYIDTPYNLLEYSAYRLRMNLGKSLKNHNFNFSWDGGWSTYNNYDRSIFAQRIMLNYAYKFINLSAIADINPTSVYDLNWYQGGTFVNYSTTVGTRISALRNKLNSFVNFGYSYLNTQKTDNLYLNANLDYKLSNIWSLTAMAYYNFYTTAGVNGSSGFQNSNLQYKIGVRMAIGSRSIGNKLSLKIYEDENLNNTLDANEQLVTDAVVKLNDKIVALTNNKGQVKYMNLKEGDYTLSVSKNNQIIPLLGVDKLSIHKNLKLNLPIVKTISIQGKMVEVKDRYDNQVADFVGINIYAQNLDNGKVTVSVTEIDGSFNFQLVEGKYKFYIQNDRYEILNNQQEILIKNNESPEEILFKFKNKELKIRKKKF